MRTLTEKDLQHHIDLCLWRLGVYINTGRWTYESSATSLAEAEISLSKARKTAKRKIRRLGAKHPDSAASINWEWITHLLTAESWWFVLWLKDRGYTDLHQRREEIELLLLSQIGREIKRLGFQLER
jgi:hypothetical protein